MSKYVLLNLNQLVESLDRCIKSCIEEEKNLAAQLDENYRQRVSYVENKLLAETLINNLNERPVDDLLKAIVRSMPDTKTK